MASPIRAVVLTINGIHAWWCEALLLLMFGPSLGALLLGWRSWGVWLQALAMLGAVGVGLQRLIEGPRWQIIPAALLSLELVSLCMVTWFSKISFPRLFGVGGSILAVAAVVCYTAFPGFAMPRPSGTYPIGTVVLHFVDRARLETLGGSPGDYREVMVQLWYPAASLRSDSHRAAVFGWFRSSNSYGAAVSEAKKDYPVLIFSPSWRGQRNENLFQIENLASHGYVIAGIDHPYSSSVVVFPDGRIVRAPDTGFWNLSSERVLEASEQRNEKVLRVRVADVEFVVSELTKLNLPGSGSRFSGRLDLSRLGIFGYSFGGAVAAQACFQDSRFKAGIDMDGTLYGEVEGAGVSQPFMFVVESAKMPPMAGVEPNSEKGRYIRFLERDVLDQQNSMERHGGYWLAVAGTSHISFTAPPAWPTIGYYTSEAGTISPIRAMRILNEYTLAFFDKYFGKSSQPLLNGPSPMYPEVEFAWPLIDRTHSNPGATG